MRLPLSWLLLLASTLPLGLTACLPSTASLQAPQDTSTPFQNRSHLAQNLSPLEAYSDESLKTYQDMLTLARDRKDRKLEGMALVGIGSIYLYQEKFTQAIAHLEPGLKIAREMKDRLAEKRALMNLTVAYANVQADKSFAYAQDLLAIAKQENDLPLQGVALQGLGVAEALRKNYQQAIPYYEQSLKIFRQVQDTERQANVLTGLSEVYSMLKQPDKAMEYLNQSEALSSKVAPNRSRTPQNSSDETTKLLAIQPNDPWNVVVGKAISSRQLDRLDEAISSFARYGEMFKATDPTAEQYSHVAQQFTRQMRSLNVKGGVYIHQIVPGGSAAQKGLAVGDIMISLNGQPISNMPEFVAVRDRAIQGKPLLAEYLRLEGNQFQRYSKSVNNLMEVELMPI